MNDVTRRFGFSPSPAHGRVPGPYTPLQDEPQDAGDICTAVGANMKTVPVPQIQSMKAYILKHHRQMIFDALNESIRAGALEMPADVDGGEIVLSAANCTFGAMNFWRYDKYTALAEVIVYPEICTDSGCVPCPLYVELWIVCQPFCCAIQPDLSPFGVTERRKACETALSQSRPQTDPRHRRCLSGSRPLERKRTLSRPTGRQVRPA